VLVGGSKRYLDDARFWNSTPGKSIREVLSPLTDGNRPALARRVACCLPWIRFRRPVEGPLLRAGPIVIPLSSQLCTEESGYGHS